LRGHWKKPVLDIVGDTVRPEDWHVGPRFAHSFREVGLVPRRQLRSTRVLEEEIEMYHEAVHELSRLIQMIRDRQQRASG
jgi:hypothetical protein